jgi:UPF0042 nucleotide-binding protein
MALNTDKANHFLILGTGGAGVTTALDIYSDFGFLTVAGVDPEQLHNTIVPLSTGQAPVAFSLRFQPDMDSATVVQAILALKQNLPNLKILTLDAPEETLVQRYMKSGKKHAFESDANAGLQVAVAAEKKQFGPIKELKDYSIDTSTTTSVELGHKIARVLGMPIDNQEFTVYINTFGFKYGAPQDAEFIFDMRFMTNPFYDESLRPMTGKDKPVRDFIFNLDHARIFFDKWADLIAEMLPLYQAQGKTRLTLAVGCTGGKHRSVCMGEELAVYLKQHCPTFNIVISHREMLRWGKPVAAPATCSAGEVSE